LQAQELSLGPIRQRIGFAGKISRSFPLAGAGWLAQSWRHGKSRKEFFDLGVPLLLAPRVIKSADHRRSRTRSKCRLPHQHLIVTL
jgi:hypothetical protein